MSSSSGNGQIAGLSAIEFRGKGVGGQIATYAKKSQRLSKALADEFDEAANEARKAMYGLKGHPALLGIDVKLRARRVAGRLKRAKELAVALAAESVKFAAEYDKQFVQQARTNLRNEKRKVDL